MPGWRVAAVLLSSLSLLLAPSLSLEDEQLPDVTHGPRNESQPLNLTRAGLYSEFARELQAVLGAEPHTKQVFGGLVDGMKQLVTATVLAQLQRLVDDVAEHAEDAWVAAEDTNNNVRPCVDGVEAAAQGAVQRSLEAMKKCVEDTEDEGERLATQAAVVTTELEQLLMSLVTAIEGCLKQDSDNKDPAEEVDKTVESGEANKSNDWEDDDGSKDSHTVNDNDEEQQRVKACLKSEQVKELLHEKSLKYNSLKEVMQHVFQTEKTGKPCIAQLYQVAKEEIEIIKKDISACVNRRLKDEF